MAKTQKSTFKRVPVSRAVSLIKQIIAFQDKTISREKALDFLQRLQSVNTNHNDGYPKEIAYLRKRMGEVLRYENPYFIFRFEKKRLEWLRAIVEAYYSPYQDGLNGIPEQSQPRPAAPSTAAPVKPLAEKNERKNAIEENSLNRVPGIITSDSLMKMRFTPFGLPAPFDGLIGPATVGFAIQVYGKGGQGKSFFNLGLSRACAMAGKRVMYVAAEEIRGGVATSTLQSNVAKIGGPHPNLAFAGELPTRPNALEGIDLVVLDSITEAGIDLERFKALRTHYPHVSWVLVFQTTTTGTFRGGQKWHHEIDTEIEVINRVAYPRKNRFGGVLPLYMRPKTAQEIAQEQTS